MVVSVETLLLAVIATGIVVWALGVERTKDATKRAGSGAKRAASSTAGLAMFGAGAGMQLGVELVNAGMAEPFAVTTILAGIAGTLGIAGYLPDLSAAQFLLIGIGIFALVLAVRRDS